MPKEPLVLAKAGAFELLATCDYGIHPIFSATCEGVAVLNRRGYNLCQACADLQAEAEKKIPY